MHEDDFIIIGTAGHIDHGKTTLVAALTGVDTDRLKEEKDRGISIDIGFAPLRLPGDIRLGIVDVPGHERFIRNMLAGAGGIDLILLVIDAREGMMPQTREHLAIVSLLRVQRGIIVLTKVDLVDEEWLALVREEVRLELMDTVLADAPMVEVAAPTGYGIQTLKDTILAELPHVPRKPRTGPFRMPIDRVFSVPGIGTVATGTVWRGSIRSGEALEALPQGDAARVRSLQVHGEAAETVRAGQRAAIALTGLKMTLTRGMTLSAPGVMQPSRLIDVRITALLGSPIPVTHRMRVRLYIGTAEILGRLLLLGISEVEPGQEALAQLSLEDEVVTEMRDHFVLRSWSPLHTVGGGTVIDPHPSRLHRRHNPRIRETLEQVERGSPAERTLQAMIARLAQSPAEIAAHIGESLDVVEQALRDLAASGAIVALTRYPSLVPQQMVDDAMRALQSVMIDYYARNKYDVWAARSILAPALRAKGFSAGLTDPLIEEAGARGILTLTREQVRLPDRSLVLTPLEQEQRTRILSALSEHPLMPPSVAEIVSGAVGRERVVKNVLHALEQEGLLTMISQELALTADAVRQCDHEAHELWRAQGAFTVANFRDRLGTSRKYAVAILEYFDRIKKTKRSGDVRDYIE